MNAYKPYKVALFGKSNCNPDDTLELQWNYETYEKAYDKFKQEAISRSEFRTLVEGMDTLVLSCLPKEHGLISIVKTMVIHSI